MTAFDFELERTKAAIEEMRMNVQHMRTTDRREAYLVILCAIPAALVILGAGFVIGRWFVP